MFQGSARLVGSPMPMSGRVRVFPRELCAEHKAIRTWLKNQGVCLGYGPPSRLGHCRQEGKEFENASSPTVCLGGPSLGGV